MDRRSFLFSASFGVVGLATGACGGSNSSKPVKINKSDLPGSFAGFTAADEPDADLSKVVWPSFVTQKVKPLYEFQLTHGDLMKYMPCYCGCGKTSGHKNNRDCYVQTVNADGSAVLDSMAPT